ncbi:MAG TPA: TauD/TfdA family dioxygenase, partial [Pyrinomonadaceae bacterium]
LNPAAWGAANRELVESLLHRHGAVLFRGFRVGGVEGFEALARSVTPELLDYKERAAPRREVGRNVYTSTEFPADQRIPLHHEMSYSHNWPTKIWFYCERPAEQGGATPIADDRKVFRLLDPKIKEVFMSKKVMYVRNYGEGVDMTWQDAFQTEDRARVEEYCRRSHTAVEWKDGDRLRTRQVRQAMATHPALGETVWFNHAHMFHVSNLQPAVRESLLSEFADDELPRNAFYGDGSPIEDSVLEEIRAVYAGAAVTFAWQEGDVLLLDNFLTSHGREPFAGPRRVVVAMAELFTNPDV